MTEHEPSKIEQHFTVRQVAEALAVSERTVRQMFGEEPGVLKISMPRLAPNARKDRPHVLLRIPASVFHRVHEQWSRGFGAIEVKRRRRVV